MIIFFQIGSIEEGCLSPPEILCVLLMIMFVVHSWFGEMPVSERGRAEADRSDRSDQGGHRDLQTERLYVVDVILLYSIYLLPYSNLPYCHFVFCSVQLWL